MLGTSEIESMVIEYIRAVLNARHDPVSISAQTPLVSSARFDSLDVVQLILFLEEKFHLNFADEPFDQYAFDTVEKIVDVVERLLGADS